MNAPQWQQPHTHDTFFQVIVFLNLFYENTYLHRWDKDLSFWV